MKLFDIDNEFLPCASVTELREGIYCCDHSQKSNRFAFAGGEGVVYIMGIAKPMEWIKLKKK